MIGWHRRRLLPLSPALVDDGRCTLVHGDFFGMVADGTLPSCDVVLVDIDHTPTFHLHPSHASFDAPAGLVRLAGRLRPGGVFALWSDAPPDPVFVGVLGEVFATAEAHVVPFANPLSGGESTNTVYVATTA